MQTSQSDAYVASIAFFEHSSDAVLFSAPDGRILEVNEAACRLLGMSRDEICRRGRHGLADPNDARWASGVRERAHSGRFSGRLSLIGGDGGSIEVEVSSAVFSNTDRELRSVVVMRAVGADDEPDGLGPNRAVVDATGVSNRPAFIHVAEQQRGHAARDGLRLGLVFMRLEEITEDGAPTPPSDTSRRAFGSLLSADGRWGDIVGRVGDDDFALIFVDDDVDGLAATVRPILERLDAYNSTATRRLQIHAGVKNLAVDDQTGMIALIGFASGQMVEHIAFERAHGRACGTGCSFSLDEPTLSPTVVVPEPAVSLSPREFSVLRLLATRRSYREIAEALFVSMNTVKTHTSHIYTKLGVNRRDEAVATARARGLLSAASRVDPLGSRDALNDDGLPAAFDRISLVAQALTGAVDMDDIVRIIVMQGLAGLRADGAIVALVVNDALVPVAAHGYPAALIKSIFPASLAEELPLTLAAREQVTVWVSNPEEAHARFPAFAVSGKVTSQAWIATPLVADGRTVGVFGASFVQPHAFSARDREYVGALTDICALALRSYHPVDSLSIADDDTFDSTQLQ